MAIKDKIAYIIKEFEGNNKSAFARKIETSGYRSEIVHKWLCGEAEPKRNYKDKICAAYTDVGVNWAWLTSLEVPVTPPVMHTPETSVTTAEINETAVDSKASDRAQLLQIIEQMQYQANKLTDTANNAAEAAKHSAKATENATEAVKGATKATENATEAVKGATKATENATEANKYSAKAVENAIEAIKDATEAAKLSAKATENATAAAKCSASEIVNTINVFSKKIDTLV